MEFTGKRPTGADLIDVLINLRKIRITSRRKKTKKGREEVEVNYPRLKSRACKKDSAIY